MSRLPLLVFSATLTIFLCLKANASVDLPPGCPSLQDVGLGSLVTQQQLFTSQDQLDNLVFSLAPGMYAANGRADCALSVANIGIDRDPVSAKSYLNRSTAYMAQHRFKEALADITHAQEILRNGGGPQDRASPGVAFAIQEADMTQFMVYQQSKDYPRALAAIERYLQTYTDTISQVFAKGVRAQVLAETGRYDEAIAECTEVLKASEAYGGACLETRGNAYYGEHKFDLAVLDYDAYVRIKKRVRALNPALGVQMTPQMQSSYDEDYARSLAEACRARAMGGWIQAAVEDCKEAASVMANDPTVRQAWEILSAADPTIKKP